MHPRTALKPTAASGNRYHLFSFDRMAAWGHIFSESSRRREVRVLRYVSSFRLDLTGGDAHRSTRETHIASAASLSSSGKNLEDSQDSNQNK